MMKEEPGEAHFYHSSFRIKLALLHQRLPQSNQIFLCRHIHATEPLEMLGVGLRIEQFVAAGAQMFDEVDERDLARVACSVKHAFPEKRAAQAYAIEPA